MNTTKDRQGNKRGTRYPLSRGTRLPDKHTTDKKIPPREFTAVNSQTRQTTSINQETRGKHTTRPDSEHTKKKNNHKGKTKMKTVTSKAINHTRNTPKKVYTVNHQDKASQRKR